MSKKEDKYLFYGNEDCQEIYIVKRINQTKRVIFRFNTTQFLETIFWQDENNFIAVGHVEPSSYFIDTFSPDDKVVKNYFYAKSEDFKIGYFLKNLRSRGAHSIGD